MRRALALVLLVVLTLGCTRPEPQREDTASTDVAADGSVNATAQAGPVNATAETQANSSAPQEDSAPPPATNGTEEQNQSAPWNGTPPTIPPMPPMPPMPPFPNQTEVHHFEGAFDLVLTAAPVAGGDPTGSDPDCVAILSDNSTQILVGAANATWVSTLPTADALALSQDTAANGTADAEGASPLKLTLKGTMVPPAGAKQVDVRLGLPSDAPALALKQDVKLTLAFDYTGPAPKAQASVC